MTFTIIWSSQTKRILESLEREVASRISKKLESICEDPYRFLTKLINEKAWKLRVGDYRIIIDIDNEKSILYILDIGHRSSIYKR